MKTKKELRKRRVIRVGFSGLYLCIAVLLIAFGGYHVVAKYVLSHSEEPVYVANSFYFESDFLDEMDRSAFTLKEGTNTIAFRLMNYPDQLRYAEVDIPYTVTLEKDSTSIETLTGKLKGGEKSFAEISFKDLKPGTYSVTAVAEGPYSISLSAQFTIQATELGIHFNVSDQSGSPNLLVTVSTEAYSGNVEILIPPGVVPDNTDPLMKNAGTVSCTVRVEAFSSYSFQFFKQNPSEDYANMITVNAE